MIAPSADSFAALARSSPWRWSALRCTVSWPADPWKTATVRAWLRRPDSLRVETLGGELLQAGREQPQRVGVYSSDGGTTCALTWASTAAVPGLRPDGLVAERPTGSLLSFDDPMYQDYHWVAMLDPVELADPHPDAEPGPPPLAVDAVTEVEHAGRPAWQAVVVPTSSYEPRCGCCPLLRTRAVDLLEYEDQPEEVLSAYPDAFRVRLDVQTGVCVLTEEIGGLTPGKGHDVAIEAVDEPMDDALFVPPRRSFRRRWGWSPAPGVQ